MSGGWLILAATVATAYPSEQEQAQAMIPVQACLDSQAARLEDGHTDIAILGRKVADACQARFEEMVTVLSQKLSPEDREKLRQAAEGMEAGSATVAIAKIRYKHQ